MAIIVTNPSTVQFSGATTETLDPLAVTLEQGFTEELANAMQPQGPLASKVLEAQKLTESSEADPTATLQILPDEVLINAVGDANFAFASAVSTEESISNALALEEQALNSAVNDLAAQEAAAALAAQMALNVPVVQSETVNVSDAQVQGVAAVANQASSSLGDTINLAGGAQISGLAMGVLSPTTAQQSVDLAKNEETAQIATVASVEAPHTVESTQQNLVTTGANEAVVKQLMSQKMPTGQVQTDLQQTTSIQQPLAGNSEQFEAVSTRSMVGQETSLAGGEVVSSSASNAVSYASEGQKPEQSASNVSAEAITKIQNLSVEKTPVIDIKSNLVGDVSIENQSDNALVVPNVLAASLKQVNSTAAVDELPLSNQATVGELQPLQAKENASSSQMASTISADALALEKSQVSFINQVEQGNSKGETALKFDAKLGANAVHSDAKIQDELSLYEPNTQLLNASVLENRPEANQSASSSFEEISSTFVSSLVGGPQRSMTTAMDWIALKPQDTPRPVVPHELRLDVGAVQVEIQRMVKQGGGHVVMELTPPDQSKFTIELKLDDKGGAYLRVEGVSDSTKTRLEQSAPQLQEQFQQMGLNLQLDMRQNRDSSSSASTEWNGNEFANNNLQTQETTPQATRAVAAERARKNNGGQIYLYA
jgi:hypothetical protein